MTYRRLRNDELAELETAFVRFLAVNGIPADDWEKIKEEEPGRTEELIKSFSDLVFHETLTKLEYLEFKTPLEIRTFHCLPDKIILRGLLTDGNSELDFTKSETPQKMLSLLQQSNAKLQMYVSEKAYNKNREAELFDMMEMGCLISDGILFQRLASLAKEDK